MSMIPASKKAKRTSNPIRNIVDNLNPPANHPKKLLNLALGDPTVHGNLFPPSVLTDAVKDLLSSHTANGYIPSTGLPSARRSIAAYNSTPGYTVQEDDVIIASGCSGAIDLVLSGLLNEGDNILVPKPAFPLYQVIAESLGAKVKYYPLLADEGWFCDLQAMDAQVDAQTKAILINNPSNPCGSNFSAEHLVQIAAIARKHSLPIIADEIYGRCVFTGEFHAMYLYAGQDVPVISVGGLAKEFIVPGWRIGWLILHDHSHRLQEYKNGLKSLTQITLGASSLLQAALPALLTPSLSSSNGCRDITLLQKYSEHYMQILKQNANLCLRETTATTATNLSSPVTNGHSNGSNRISGNKFVANGHKRHHDEHAAEEGDDDEEENTFSPTATDDFCPELLVIEPKGAMYTMIRVDIAAFAHELDSLGQPLIKDDADFARLLLQEENLFILPGQCFNMPNFVRLVICPPEDVLQDAFARMKAFCSRHRQKGKEEEEGKGKDNSGNSSSNSTNSHHHHHNNKRQKL